MTQVETMRGIKNDHFKQDGLSHERFTPSGFAEGTTATNDRNYNTDELRKEVDREVAQIKAFFVEEEKVSMSPAKGLRNSIIGAAL